MKLNNWLYGAMALGMLSACSSDDTPSQGEVTTVTDGYLAVKINLPSTPSSRAANDIFDDGTANEYAVNSMALILFSGSNEKDAVISGAYNINFNDAVTDTDNDNITTSYLTAVQVSKAEGANLYGLVVVNYTDVMSVSDKTVTISGETEAFTGKFSDLVGKVSGKKFYSDGADGTYNFFMTNAPLSTAMGGLNTATAPSASSVQTLVNLNNALYKTAEEAKNSPAGSVYVERAVAKATLSIANGAGANIGDEELEVTNVMWKLDNTEPTSYIVRNLGNAEWMGYSIKASGYRFAGAVPMGTTSIQPIQTLYRTYWCEDPSYGIASPSLTTDVESTKGFVAAVSTNPLYCHENTFTVANQNHKNTTRALVKATIGNGDTFFTVNGNEDMIYSSSADAESFSVAFILNSDLVKTAVKSGLGENENLTLDNDNYKDYLTITFLRNDKGIREVSSVKFNNDKFSKTPEWSAENEAKVIEDANNYYRIAEYENGVNYYEIRFKHFADDLAPWSSEANSTPTTAEAYPGYDAVKWLGRYGMVRNNWYDVAISGFKHLGEPALPNLEVSTDDTPDDENSSEEWIAFKVNILSWAKRTQNHEF